MPDGLAPSGARSSAGTVMTKKLTSHKLNHCWLVICKILNNTYHCILYGNALDINVRNVQCGVVITWLIFSKIPAIDAPYLTRQGIMYGGPVSLVITNFDLCNVWVVAVLYEILCYIGSRHNGTRQYLKRAILNDNHSPCPWSLVTNKLTYHLFVVICIICQT